MGIEFHSSSHNGSKTGQETRLPSEFREHLGFLGLVRFSEKRTKSFLLMTWNSEDSRTFLLSLSLSFDKTFRKIVWKQFGNENFNSKMFVVSETLIIL